MIETDMIETDMIETGLTDLGPRKSPTWASLSRTKVFQTCQVI